MRIGITGGIGAGKSYVSQLLTASFAIPVYDCDREAKRLMQSSATLRRQLTALVGADAYLPDGTLNKPAMALYLFADGHHASRVNAIVHPAVKEDFLSWAQRLEEEGAEVVALESALLVDARLDEALDAVIFVDAPLELRLQRAMQRDGATEEQIRARVLRQRSDDVFRQTSDFVVINDGRDLTEQLKTIIQTLKH